MPLDSRIEVVTPENIAFQYRVAGPFRRLPAFLIDIAVKFGLVMMLSAALTISFAFVGAQGVGAALSLVLWFVVSWFYGGLFETFWNGQTPGKRMMGIRVLATDGEPVNALQAVLRNVLREVDAMPVVPIPFPELAEVMPAPVIPLYQLGLLAMMLNDRYQRLGDLACGTMVVVEEPPAVYGVAKVAGPEAIRLASTLPHMEVPRSLARALSDYVQRRTRFSGPRRAEIAGHLAKPLIERFKLPRETNYDLLLCALYYRTFFAHRLDQEIDAGLAGEPAFMEPPEVISRR